MAERNLTIVINAKDGATGVLKNISRRAGDITGSVFKANVAFEALSKTIEYGTRAIQGGANVLKGWVEEAGKFELTTVAFETMLGSAEKAKNLLGDMVDFAKKTPFRLEEVQSGVKMLIAMGSSANETLSEMEMLGNVAAGLGVPLERIVLNFGQIRTQGKLTGRELRDFNVAGVPLVETLAQMNGVSKEFIATMVEEGDVTFEMVKEAFGKMTGEGGRFNDLMDKQAQTFPGILSNIGDSFEQLGRRVVGISDTGEIKEGSIFGRLKRAGEDFQDWIDTNEEVITEKFQSIVDAGMKLGKEVFDTLEAFIRDNKDDLEAFGKGFDELAGSIGSLMEGGSGEFIKAVGHVFLNDVAAAGIRAVGWAFETLAKGIDQLKATLDEVSRSGVLKTLDTLNKQSYSKVGGLFGPLGSIAGFMVKRQHGGMIPGHPNQPVPAILHGGERIVSRTGVDVGGSSQGVTINFNGDLSVRSDQDITSLAQEISRILGRQAEFARIGVGA